MKLSRVFVLLLLTAMLPCVSTSQTEKALTNSDILRMSKGGFDSSLIVKAIESSATDFDVSPDALLALKTEGVPQSVLETMLSAHANKPTAAVEAAHGAAAPAAKNAADAGCDTKNGCLLRDGTDVPLALAADISSKTAKEGDSVEFLLNEDLKVGSQVVALKGSHAVATVSSAKKAGMMGRPGELNVQLQYLIVAGNHVRLRGTKGKEGESKTGATIALTVIFGPIGLIKHGKNVSIPQGTALKAYSDQDIWLSPLNN